MECIKMIESLLAMHFSMWQSRFLVIVDLLLITIHMQPEPSLKNTSKYEDCEPIKRRNQMDPNKRAKWEREQNHIKTLIDETDFSEILANPDEISIVAGVDVSFSGKFDNAACSGLLIYDVKKKKIVYEDYEYVILKEEYLPGFLAFRELPPTLELFKRLKESRPELWPQVILVDGNGILHKRRCGYACHLGVLLKTPTIGCAKTFFDVDGLHQHEVEEDLNDCLTYHGDSKVIVGKSGRQWCTAVLSDVNQNKHLYISVGHMISLKSATAIAMKMLKYETPEPVRLVDRRSRQMIRKLGKQDFEKAKSYQMTYLLQDPVKK